MLDEIGQHQLNTTKMSYLTPELREIAVLVNSTISTAAFAIGKHLKSAKDISGHGDWIKFLKTIGMEVRSAQRLMRYSKIISELGLPEDANLPSMDHVLSGHYALDLLREKQKDLKAESKRLIETSTDPVTAKKLEAAVTTLHTMRNENSQIQDDISNCEKEKKNNSRMIDAQKIRIRNLEDEREALQEREAIQLEGRSGH